MNLPLELLLQIVEEPDANILSLRASCTTLHAALARLFKIRYASQYTLPLTHRSVALLRQRLSTTTPLDLARHLCVVTILWPCGFYTRIRLLSLLSHILTQATYVRGFKLIGDTPCVPASECKCSDRIINALYNLVTKRTSMTKAVVHRVSGEHGEAMFMVLWREGTETDLDDGHAIKMVEHGVDGTPYAYKMPVVRDGVLTLPLGAQVVITMGGGDEES